MKDVFKQQGAFSWCELVTPDAKAARDFYTRLLGWNTEEMPMEDMTYSILKVGEEGVGGIMSTPPGAEGSPPHWGVYVTVDNVDATARKAQELGAKTIVPPTDIPDVGRFYMFQDPQGAVLSVITYINR